MNADPSVNNTIDKVRELQRALYGSAKRKPERRFQSSHRRVNAMRLKLLAAVGLCVTLLSNIMVVRAQSNMNDDAAQQRITRITQQAAKIFGNTHSISTMKRYLKAQGLVEVGTPGVSLFTTNTQANDVIMSTPWVDYDSTTGWYLLWGEMTWKLDAGGYPYWQYDENGSCPSACNMGGSDAMSIWVDNATGLQNKGYECWTYDYHGTIFNDLTTASSNSNGAVGFEYNDQYWSDPTVPGGSDYNSDTVLIVLKLLDTGKATSIGVHSQYNHTWSTTSISSFSVSTSGVSATFSNSSYQWPAVSPIYYW